MIKLLSKHVFKEELNMAKKVSNRKPLFGNSRSHALNSSRKKQRVNMQKVTLNGVTVVMSTKEAKKFRKKVA